jgi:hypothetical protein
MMSLDKKWNRRIAILASLYCLLGILQLACAVVYFFFDLEFTAHVWDKIFFSLPEIDSILSVIIWIYVAIANVMIFFVAIVLLIAWEIVAPIVALLSIPSVVGGIGALYKRRWALKVLFFTSFFYGLLFFPLGIIMTILSVKAYRHEKKQLVSVQKDGLLNS